MRRIVFRSAIAAIAVGAASCTTSDSGSSSGTTLVACDVQGNAHTCSEFTGDFTNDQASQVPQVCTASGGIVVSGCPTVDRVGTCVSTGTGGFSGLTINVTLYAPASAATGAQDCASIGGKWTPAG